LERAFHTLRIWDSEAADRPDVLIAASKEIQRRIELYWRRDSQVITPPVDDFWLEEKAVVSGQRSDYFFIASTLVPYKRIELAIEACNTLKLPLIIAGEGPHRKVLEKLAGPTVKFLGFQPKEKLRKLYANARATIFPGDEDFGLVPLESMACGTPVIAFKKGGALETITEGKTGMFFQEPTAESLQKILTSFDEKKFHADECREHAKKFSRKHFEDQIKKVIAIMSL
jgi:glycosyltransferase involved in cell wall biosynthesis